MSLDKNFLLLILSAFLILAFVMFFVPLQWDSAVYLLNSEYFFGKNIYFDDNAPRLLPQIIAKVWRLTGVSEIAARLISVSMSLGLIAATYLIANELFNKRTAFFASLFLLFNPLFLLYSSKVYTDIPLALMVTFTIYLFYNGVVKGRSISLLLSGVFITISILIKYPGLLLYPITLSFVLLAERKALKNPCLWLSYLISIGLLIPSINQFSGGIVSYISTFPYSMEIQNLSYFITLPLILLTATPLIILLLLKRREKLLEREYLILLLTIFFIFGFYQTVPSKDIRYLLPLFPSAFILAAKELDEKIMEKMPEEFGKIKINFKKIYGYFLLPLIVSFIILYLDFYFKPNSIVQAGKYLNSAEDSLIISNYWPEISYYSQKTAKWFPSKEERLYQQMAEFKIDYVVAIEIKKLLPLDLRILGIYTDTEPSWVKIKNIDSLKFLKKIKQFEDNQKITAVYKFNEDIPNRTFINVTDKSSLARLLPN